MHLVTGDYIRTSKAPMIWQNRVYFLNHRDGAMNLWSISFDGLDARQLTHHDDYEAKSPSLSAGRIAYQHGASSSRGPTGAGPR
jgi:tricorn protease